MWIRVVGKDQSLRINLRSDAAVRELFAKVQAAIVTGADPDLVVLYFAGKTARLLRNTADSADELVRDHVVKNNTLFMHVKKTRRKPRTPPHTSPPPPGAAELGHSAPASAEPGRSVESLRFVPAPAREPDAVVHERMVSRPPNINARASVDEIMVGVLTAAGYDAHKVRQALAATGGRGELAAALLHAADDES